MIDVLYAKFSNNPTLKDTLLSTGESTLVEDTTGWHDNYWGICTCPKCYGIGLNKLDKALMEVRDKLIKENNLRNSLSSDVSPTKEVNPYV